MKNILARIRQFFAPKAITLKGFNAIRTKVNEGQRSPYVKHPITGQACYRYGSQYFKTFKNYGNDHR